jgi:hypothetical protein
MLHTVLGALIVVIAWVSSGGVGRALVVALGYVLAATAWSWWRMRQRLRRRVGGDGTP